MKCVLTIDLPSLSPKRFVEYKRSFMVRGRIDCESTLPDDCHLSICLFDSKKNLVRKVETKKKNGDMYLDYPSLVKYPKGMDDDLKKLKEYGFSILCVDDINKPEESLHLASRKCWYSDKYFEGIIVSGTDISSGLLFNDDLRLVKDDLSSFELLEMGEYELVVSLIGKGINEVVNEKLVIGKRDSQIICRFHPDNHHKRMEEWVKENNYAIIKDTLPGYLDAYLGVWYYHMGLIKTYHANDLVLYENQVIHMFIYLIDPTSTSYKAELPYVQRQHLIEKGLFHAYYYDIGEAIVKGRKAIIKEFKDDEYMSICRIDVVNDDVVENEYRIDESGIKESIFDLDNIKVNANERICIMGVVKPTQMDDEDLIFNEEDNTCLYKNFHSTIRYKFKVNNKEYVYDHQLMMERFEKESIGKSAYEFYNLFTINPKWKNCVVNVEVNCLDNNERMTNAQQSFIMYIV